MEQKIIYFGNKMNLCKYMKALWMGEITISEDKDRVYCKQYKEEETK